MNTYEIVAQVRMVVSADNAETAEDDATDILNNVVIDIEHIEVLP